MIVGRVCLLALRLALGGLFLFAAWVKLGDLQDFAMSIKGFKVVPEHLVPVVMYVTPWLEVAFAVALIVGLWSRAAALGIAGMLLGFIGLIASVLLRDLTVECGCFGKLSLACEGPMSTCNIIQNSVLILIGLPVVIWGGGLLSLDRLLKPMPHAAADPQGQPRAGTP